MHNPEPYVLRIPRSRRKILEVILHLSAKYVDAQYVCHAQVDQTLPPLIFLDRSFIDSGQSWVEVLWFVVRLSTTSRDGMSVPYC